MSRFLLEIQTEEVPSSLQIKAQRDIEDLFVLYLKDKNIVYQAIKVMSTPRRLIVFIEGLPEKTLEKKEEKKGPKTDAPANVIEGFLKSNKLQLNDCFKKSTSKGEFLFFYLIHEGGSIQSVFANIIVEILNGIKFKKSMRWNETQVNWARPIRGLLAMIDDSVLDFEFAGISSSCITKGHRFLSKDSFIKIDSIDSYFAKMEENFVILSFDQRREKIITDTENLIAKYGVDFYKSEELLKEICYLVEYPCVLEAEIPGKYMNLPKELLIEILVKNQRYINLINKDGSLFNRYLIVSNMKTSDNGNEIIKGNSKVLQARLEDGLFFYHNDLRESSLSRAQRLKNINFFESLGTIFDKTQRVKSLFENVFSENQDILCDIYKSDLCSESVFEIPELQGIMGYYYTKNEGYSEEIALAIRDQYKPQGPNDSLPQTLLSAKLALLDKLDTLITFFSISKAPSGSKDPFALRRAAIGIIRIIEQFGFDIKLQTFITSDLSEFFKERIQVYLSIDYNIEIIKSIIRNSHDLNIKKIIEDVKFLDGLLKSENGKKVYILYKRISNIVKEHQNISLKITADLFSQGIEKSLYESYFKISHELSDIIKYKGIEEALVCLSYLKEEVDVFLDEVNLKQSETQEIKNNRIALLLNVLGLISLVVNFEYIDI